MFRISNLVLRIFLGSIFLCGCQRPALYKDKRVMMGTYVEVVSPEKRAARIIFAEIDRVENLLSKYKKESEISRLNQQGRLKVSPDTMFILRSAKRFWLESNGAFDVTVGPVVELWGFKDKKYYLPKEEEIKQRLKLVGFEKIIFNDLENMIEFKTSGMQVDLGAIAKGYAVDCAVDRLKKAGVRSCLINAGGDIYCLGDKFGRPWHVAIQNPREDASLGYLELKDAAVATSGDYAQYFMSGGRRYSHIFNPQTGYPTDSGVVSVTVVASDCLTADALATMIFVLGKRRGIELTKRFPDIKVKIIEEADVQYYE